MSAIIYSFSFNGTPCHPCCSKTYLQTCNLEKEGGKNSSVVVQIIGLL
uniref:Uncharacterized protein n=1 Tax=Aegilops tauschii subsp. strangulata TaxID=200361 RepID=A0A453T053_AEGTS